MSNFYCHPGRAGGSLADASAAYGFEVPTRDCRELVGTSNPPHSWRAAIPATERCSCCCKRASAIGRADRGSCEDSMSVDADTVRRIAHLARIKVAEDEIENLKGELNAILAFV